MIEQKGMCCAGWIRHNPWTAIREITSWYDFDCDEFEMYLTYLSIWSSMPLSPVPTSHPWGRRGAKFTVSFQTPLMPCVIQLSALTLQANFVVSSSVWRTLLTTSDEIDVAEKALISFMPETWDAEMGKGLVSLVCCRLKLKSSKFQMMTKMWVLTRKASSGALFALHPCRLRVGSRPTLNG